MQLWQDLRQAAVGEAEMEEREGMGRKANTKVIMAVLVEELEEVELRVGVTSSINTSRIIGVSHWRGVILCQRKGFVL